jgi:hypothetical protein
MMIPRLRTQVAPAIALRSRFGTSGAVWAAPVTDLLGLGVTGVLGLGLGVTGVLRLVLGVTGVLGANVTGVLRAGVPGVLRAGVPAPSARLPCRSVGLERARSADGAGNGSPSSASRAARTAEPSAISSDGPVTASDQIASQSTCGVGSGPTGKPPSPTSSRTNCLVTSSRT